jgi:hypothetical protein
VDAPLTKKQKNVDKHKISAPYGSIISVQSKTRIRGVDIRKKKKHWCTVCQPISPKDNKTKIITVTEHLEVETEVIDGEEVETDTYMIKYYCSRCQCFYFPDELKKINHFLNQITIVLSVGTQPLLNIMMFKDSFKVAGCKSLNDAVEAVLILWQDYIYGYRNKIGADGAKAWSLKPGEETPKFIFETVMRNVDFKLNFPIERSALNSLMNRAEFSKKVFMSQYEATGHTNVNVKMYSVKPNGFLYDMLVIPDPEVWQPYFVKAEVNIFKTPKKKSKPAYVTFIVFSSSEIILSGRYDENMKEMYEFFVGTVFSHRGLVEEKLRQIDRSEVLKIAASTRR